MSVVEDKLQSADEFLRLTDPKARELIAGKVVEMTPAGPLHGRIAGRLSGFLTAAVARGELGEVYVAETAFLVATNPDTIRVPDLAFVRRDRVTRETPSYFDGPPDLAVEVVSANDRVKDVSDKTAIWLDAGAREVWVVWPNNRTVVLHRPGQKPLTLREQDTLESSDLLPGLACPVGELFA